MSQPSLGRAGLELMFGSWCRGWLTVVSTHDGEVPDVTAQAGLERVPFAGGIGMHAAVSPELGRVRRQSAFWQRARVSHGL